MTPPLSTSFLFSTHSNVPNAFYTCDKDLSEKAKSKRSSRKDGESSKSKSPPSSGRSKHSATGSSVSGGGGNISSSGSGHDSNKLSVGEKTSGEWSKLDLETMASGEGKSPSKSKRSSRRDVPATMSDDGGPEARSRSKRKKYNPAGGVPPLATSSSRNRSSLHGEAASRLVAQVTQMGNKCSADWDNEAGSSGEEDFEMDDKRLFNMGGSHSNMRLEGMSSHANAAGPIVLLGSSSARTAGSSSGVRQPSRVVSSINGPEYNTGAVGSSGASAFSSFERSAQPSNVAHPSVPSAVQPTSSFITTLYMPKPAPKTLPPSLIELMEQIKSLETNVRHEFASLSGRQFSTLLELLGRMKTTLQPPQDGGVSMPPSKGLRSHSSFTPFVNPATLGANPQLVAPTITINAPISSMSAHSIASNPSGGVISSSNNNVASIPSVTTSNVHSATILTSASTPAANVNPMTFSGTETTLSSSPSVSSHTQTTNIPPQVSSKPYMRLGRQTQDAGMQTEPRSMPPPPLVSSRPHIPARYASRDDMLRQQRRSGKSSSDLKRVASGNIRSSRSAASKGFPGPADIVDVTGMSSGRPAKNLRAGSSSALLGAGGRIAVPGDGELGLNSGVDIYKPISIPERPASTSSFSKPAALAPAGFTRQYSASGVSGELAADSVLRLDSSPSALALVAESGSNSSNSSLGIFSASHSAANLASGSHPALAIETSSQESSNSSAGSGILSRGPSGNNVTWHSHFDLLRSLDESEEELRRDTQGLAISPSAAYMMGSAPITRLVPPGSIPHSHHHHHHHHSHAAATALRMLQSEGARSAESPDIPVKGIPEERMQLSPNGSSADSLLTPSPGHVHHHQHHGNIRHFDDLNRSEAEESSESQHSTPIRESGPIITIPASQTRMNATNTMEMDIQTPILVRANPAPISTSGPVMPTATLSNPSSTSAFVNPSGGLVFSPSVPSTGSAGLSSFTTLVSTKNTESEASISSRQESKKKKKKKGSSSSSSSNEPIVEPAAKPQPLFAFSSRSAFAPKRTSDPS